MLPHTEIIRKLDIFETLDEKIIKNIAKMCIEREFITGDYIVKRGEAGLGLYFITAGRAKVEIDRDGVKVVVALLHEGDFLGELSMIDDNVRSADVICVENTSCLLLTRDSFTRLLKKHPEIALQMAKALVARIRATNEKLSAAPVVAPAPFSTEPQPQSVGAPATVAAAASAAASSNGGSGTASSSSSFNAIEFYSSTKHRTKDFLIDLFSSLYVMKMMTRFSAAMVGCPVEVQAEKGGPEVVQMTIDGVKLALFPSEADQVLQLNAYGEGEFSAVVFRPGRTEEDVSETAVSHVAGTVSQQDRLRLHVPAGAAAWLESLDRTVSPLSSRHLDRQLCDFSRWNIPSDCGA